MGRTNGQSLGHLRQQHRRKDLTLVTVQRHECTGSSLLLQQSIYLGINVFPIAAVHYLATLSSTFITSHLYCHYNPKSLTHTPLANNNPPIWHYTPNYSFVLLIHIDTFIPQSPPFFPFCPAIKTFPIFLHHNFHQSLGVFYTPF